VKRVPEPELMDDPAQAKAYALADFEESHQAFVAHFRERFPDFREGEVIDLGCGPADVAIRFCRVYPAVRLSGVDGARAMLDLARLVVKQAALADRIELEQHYLPDPALPGDRFDGVISNSLLHHLDDPLVLWQTVKQVGKPGASVMVMDLRRPASVMEAMHLVGSHAAGAPSILQRDFYNSLLAAYRVQEVKRQLFKVDLDHFRIEEVGDRHLLIWGVL
jgi:ubiquinone/menaquinone biosynthesis C-methylase UbiE